MKDPNDSGYHRSLALTLAAALYSYFLLYGKWRFLFRHRATPQSSSITIQLLGIAPYGKPHHSLKLGSHKIIQVCFQGIDGFGGTSFSVNFSTKKTTTICFVVFFGLLSSNIFVFFCAVYLRPGRDMLAWMAWMAWMCASFAWMLRIKSPVPRHRQS